MITEAQAAKGEGVGEDKGVGARARGGCSCPITALGTWGGPAWVSVVWESELVRVGGRGGVW
eukprot:COSAG02_NODE_3635_length_6446_cov_1.452025_2_plen_62_part_00